MARYESLAGRRILITGGGRGFGREMALAFAAQGSRLVLTAGRNKDELSATVAEVDAIAPGCCAGIVADVSNAEECERVAAFAEARFGGIDVLFNNAARSPAEALTQYSRGAARGFWNADPAGYERLVQTNVVGPFLMARAAVSGMQARGFGRIVNLLTSQVTMVMGGIGPYGASKAALEASTVVWARDLEGSGVTVNGLLPGGASDTALIPGAVGTRAIVGFRAGADSGGEEGRVVGLLPADVIVPPALWLAADESAAWNGRRFVGKNWDDALGWEVAVGQAVTPRQEAPKIL